LESKWYTTKKNTEDTKLDLSKSPQIHTFVYKGEDDNEIRKMLLNVHVFTEVSPSVDDNSPFKTKIMKYDHIITKDSNTLLSLFSSNTNESVPPPKLIKLSEPDPLSYDVKKMQMISIS
jgi:hypothetical protein